MVTVIPTVGCFTIPKYEVENLPSKFIWTTITIKTFKTCGRSGYRHIFWCGEKADRPLKVDPNAHGPERDILYRKCKDWSEGKIVKRNLTGRDTIDWWYSGRLKPCFRTWASSPKVDTQACQIFFVTETWTNLELLGNGSLMDDGVNSEFGWHFAMMGYQAIRPHWLEFRTPNHSI